MNELIEKLKTKIAENKLIAVKWISAVIPLIFLIIIFNRIPEQIPVQFNEAGEVIKESSKYSFDMILQASLGLLAAIIMSAVMKVIIGLNFSPSQNHYEKALKVMEFVNVVITVMFSVFSIMILIKYV